MKDIREDTLVRTLVDREGCVRAGVMYPAGSIGAVAEVYLDHPVPGCDVEIWDDLNYTVDVATYSFDEVEVLSDEEKEQIMKRADGRLEELLARFK